MTRILWAVDPYQDSAASLRREGALIRRWFAEGDGGFVEPVFVLSPAVASMPARAFKEWSSDLRRESLRSLEGLTRGLKLPGLRAPQVLVEESDHSESLADVLLAHARKERIDLIVIGTHAKGGVRRLFLGSFAETLLLRSTIDLMVVNPGYEAPGGKHRSPRILHPTGLSEFADGYFTRVMWFAQSKDARLELIHARQKPSGALSKLLGKGKEITAAETGARKDRLAQFMSRAEAGEIEVNSQISESNASVSDQILERAKRTRPELIAIAAKGGESHKSGVSAGSVTRQVIRQASCPVWVLHQSTAGGAS